jgi:1,3-propanediol dehydrogenase
MFNTIPNFTFNMPTRIEYGVDKFKETGKLIKGIGRKALIVSYDDKCLKPLLEECLQLLEKEGIQSVLFEEAVTNPGNELMDKGSRLAVSENCDFVIGFGGGSPIDIAKAIAVTAVEGVGIWEIVEGRELTSRPLPIIAVPTTSGTGSEVTQYAVISNSEEKKKEGIGKKEFYPVLSIVDPVLTVSMPEALTAAVGLDALTHAIEGYTTRYTNPATDALAELAISLVGRSLRKAVFDGKDIDARSDMMLASMLAGMVITHADTSLAHVIGEAMGAVFNLHHGLAVSLTLPAVMEYNCFTNVEKFKNISELLGENTDGMSALQSSRLAPAAVRQLIYDLEVPRGLASVGANEDAHVLDLCTRPGWDGSNLRSASKDDFTKLIKGSLSPEMSYWNFESK